MLGNDVPVCELCGHADEPNDPVNPDTERSWGAGARALCAHGWKCARRQQQMRAHPVAAIIDEVQTFVIIMLAAICGFLIYLLEHGS